MKSNRSGTQAGLPKIVLALLASLIVVVPAQAQLLSNIPGVFAETGFGVRPAGMGEAFTAISDDANAFITNPAGLLRGRRASVTANYARLFGLVPSGYFGMLYPLSERYSVGAGFQFVGDDALTENTAGLSVAFTPPNLPLGGNEVYFDQMSFGVSLKGRWASFGNNPEGGDNRITGTGVGYSVDFGYLFLLNQHLSLGVMIRDLLNSFNWDSSVSGDYSESVPATLRIGAAYRVDELTLSFDLRKNLHDDTANRAYFGAERTFLNMLILRAGFSNNLGTSDLNRRWSFGASLTRGIFQRYSVRVNTAYRVGNVENLFRFGLDIDWGRPKKPASKGRMY